MLISLGKDKPDANDVLDEASKPHGPDKGITFGMKHLLIHMKAIDQGGV